MTQKNGWRDAAVCLALALGVAALYFPSAGYDFASLEDRVYVVGNPHVNKGLASAFGWAFQAGYAALWQPLTWLSHALDCQIYGLKPGGHHATNVLLHALNSALVFLVLRRLTGAFWRSAAVAAFFAWHPLHVESVAWIAERSGLLCAFFFLLALLSYVRYAENLKTQNSQPQELSGRNSKFFYALALLLFALALMSKPAALMLPCVLLLLDWWPLGRLAATGAPAERSAAGKAVSLLVEKIPFFALSAASIVLSSLALQRAGGLAAAMRLPLKLRCVTAFLSCYRFVAQTFWPADLGAAYPVAIRHSRWELLGVAAILAAICFLAFRARKERPYWLVGWLWFLAMLVPTLNLVQTGDQPMADRNFYLASIGLWMLICWEAADLVAWWRFGRIALGAVAVVALAACAVASSFQLGCWKNDGTLLSRIPYSDYNFMAHANYAAYLMRQPGQLAKAQSECQMAIAIAPKYALLRALEGEILFFQGKFDQSVEELHNALHLQPDLLPAHMTLGRALLAGNHPDEAADEFRAILRAVPRDFEAHNWLAQTMMLRHKTTDAVAEYHASLALQANQPEALNNLAWVLATDPHPEIRRGAEAVQLASRACLLTRNQEPALLGTLAAALAESGDFDKAVATGQKAHDLAQAQGRTPLADRNLQLLKLYRDHKPFHEKPSSP
jgi:Flp pilus assembly protein TadD